MYRNVNVNKQRICVEKGYVLDHKRSLHKFQKNLHYQQILYPARNKISNRQQRDNLCICLETKNTLLSYPWVQKKFTTEIKKYFELKIRKPLHNQACLM